jgi:hypothetical protein
MTALVTDTLALGVLRNNEPSVFQCSFLEYAIV